MDPDTASLMVRMYAAMLDEGIGPEVRAMTPTDLTILRTAVEVAREHRPHVMRMIDPEGLVWITDRTG